MGLFFLALDNNGYDFSTYGISRVKSIFASAAQLKNTTVGIKR